MNIKAAGNIPRKELISADGKNVYVDIDTIQLLKLSEADFFYSAKINVKRKKAQVVIKEENINKLSKLVNIPVSEIRKKNTEIANRVIYNELKKAADLNSEKLEYRVIDEAGAEMLKSKNLKIAYFGKDDKKINIAFLSKDTDIINRTLSSASIKANSESEKGRNLKINNEIKKEAALSGEKPLYRIIDSSELDKLRQTDIKFAVFENKDKFNIIFLKESEASIKTILNDSFKQKTFYKK